MPTGRPVITIVTICLNNLQGLRSTFESLGSQDFTDVQHVVIDGGSTDGSLEYLAASHVFANTIVVSEPDNGVYDAMNKGARLASGVLLNFMNAGDRLAHPGVLSRVAASQVRDGWEWGFGLARVVDPAGRPVRPVRPVRYSLRRHALGLVRVSHQATYMRTELFRRLGGFDLRYQISSDVDLLLRAGAIARPAAWPVVDVLYLAGGVSQRRAYRGVWEQLLSRRKIPSARLGPLPLDTAWTAARLAVIAARWTGRRLLDRLSRGRFTRWWAARGL